MSAADQLAALAAAGLTSDDSIGALRMHAVRATASQVDALRAAAGVASVEVDRSRAAEAAPSDPSYGDQWSLPRIGWDLARDGYTPAGSAVVAILDTGVDASHPDLDDNLLTGASFVAGATWNADANGHGTAMAGIVAAETDNGVGIAGVGYAGVRVLPVTVLDAAGLGRDSDIIEGLVWAVDHGADVVLMSFSAYGYSAALQAAVDYAWSRDVVLVAAVGNDASSSASFPAGDRGVIGVSSTDSADLLAVTSNVGESVFVAAPGESVLTTAVGGGYTTISGTSAAAAAVAGAAAMVAANDASASNGVIVGRLARNADAVGTLAETGNGRLNLSRALYDQATDSVQPAGAEPGDGGPFVGPYQITAIGNFEQCRNGTFASPQPCAQASPLVVNYQNGNLGGANSHYREGDSVPFRASVTGVAINTANRFIDIQYDNTASGEHAYDYLTTWNLTESANNDPCVSFPCSGAPLLFNIPTDPSLALATPPVIPLPQAQRQMAMWGGTIQSITYTAGPGAGPSVPEGSSLQTTVRVTYTATTSTVVFAWGGHVATEIDWGTGDSAGNISGSPYHMRIIASSEGNVGNQDRSASAFAPTPTPITTTASASAIDLGQSVTDTATVVEVDNDGPPNGTITFFVCGPATAAPDCRTGGTQVGAPVTAAAFAGGGDNRRATSTAFTPTIAGFYCFRAQYVPAAAAPYSPAHHTNLTTECFVVRAAPGMSTQASASSITSGSVTDTATLTQTGQLGTVAGTVTFFVCGPATSVPNCATGGTQVGSAVTVSGGSATSASFTPTTPGTYCFRAVFAPGVGSNYLATSHTNQTFGTNGECFVLRAVPGLSTQASSGSVSLGTPVTDTATFTQAGQLGPIAGTVDFYVCGPSATAPNCATGGTLVTDDAAIAGGVATSTGFTPLLVGTYCFRAEFTPAAGSNYLATSHTNQSIGTNGECFQAAGTPNIDVEKDISVDGGLNYVDADTGPGPFTAINGAVKIRFTVTNSGTVPLTGITLTDSDFSTASCTVPASLAVGASFTCTIDVTLAVGAHTNTATATGQFLLVTVSDTDDVHAFRPAPALSLDKSSPDTSYDLAGDVLSYSFLVTNTGNVTLAGPITVSDDKATDEACPAVPVGGLVPGGSITCTASYTVTQADLDAGSVTNVASASTTYAAAPVTSNTDTVTIDADQQPELTLVKTASPATYDSVGDTISYSYLLTNTGNVTLVAPFSIGDDQAADEACPASPTSLAPGASITCTASDTASQADLDAGSITNTAVGSGVFGLVTIFSNADSETVTAVQSPALSLDKSSPDTSYDLAGDVLSYSFLVTNTGNVTLAGPITVSDDKATDESCPAVPVGGLVPGGSITCTASYTVTQADLDAGSVTNVASASTTYAAAPVTSNTDTVTIDADQQPELTLVKTASPATYDGVGDTISYSYLLTNTGNVTLVAPFSIGDDQAADEACPASPTSLAPGASITCTASDTASQADLDAGSITNTAVGSGVFGLVTIFSNADSETVTAVQSPALSLDKSSPDTSYDLAGDVLSYSFLVTNTGNVTLAGPITVSDDKATDEACPAVPVGGLVPGGSITCTASYTVTQADLDAGSVTNVASASTTYAAAPVTSNTDTVTIDADQQPELTLVKTASPATYDGVGDTISYSYLLTNTGNVTLVAPFSIGDDQAADEACPASPTSLAPGASITCTASDTASQADLDAGSITNTAVGSGVFGLVTIFSNADSETVTAVQTITISIDKEGSLDLGLDGVASPGDLVSYTFDVTNTGNVTLTGAVVSDPSVSVSCPAAIDPLGPGETVTCTASYAIDQDDIDAGQVVNTADVDASGPQGQPATDSDTENVPVPQVRTIDLDKEGTLDLGLDGIASPGDVISYTFDLENTGNVTLTGVVVTDPSVTVSCPPAASTLSPGETATCTASYAITQADINAGEVLNTASVSSTAPQGQTVSDTDNETVDVPQVVTISIVKSGVLDDGPDDVANPGDTIGYTFLVTNTGNVTLTGVVVSDPLVTISCATFDGSLDPGESVTCSATYVIDQDDIDAGEVDNTATPTAAAPRASRPTTRTASPSTSPRS